MRASVDPGSSSSRRERVDGIERSDGVVGGYTGSTMEVTTFNQSFGDAASATAADFPVWDKIGAIVRLSYGIGNFFFLFLGLFLNLLFILLIGLYR